MNNEALTPDPQSGSPAAGSEQRQIAMSANRIDARELFNDTREIFIAHGKEIYRLRLTSQNKLILTK